MHRKPRYASLLLSVLVFAGGCGGSSGDDGADRDSAVQDAGGDAALDTVDDPSVDLGVDPPTDLTGDASLDAPPDSFDPDLVADAEPDDQSDDQSDGGEPDLVPTPEVEIRFAAPTAGTVLSSRTVEVQVALEARDDLAGPIALVARSGATVVARVEDVADTARFSVTLPPPARPNAPIPLTVEAFVGEDLVGRGETSLYVSPEVVAMARLREASAIRPVFASEDGVPTALSVQVPVSGRTARDQALGFLRAHGSVFGFDGERDTFAVASTRRRRLPSGVQESSVRFSQRHEGVPVIGGDLVVVVREDGDGTSAVWAAGGWSTAAPAIPESYLPGGVAHGLAVEHVGGAGRVGRPRLAWYDPRLAGPEPTPPLGGVGGPELAWQVRVSPAPSTSVGDFEVIVGAETGRILAAWEVTQRESAEQEVWDFEFEELGWRCGEVGSIAALGYPLVCDGEGCAPGAAPEAQQVQRYVADFTDYMDTTFGWSGFDGQGGVARSLVRLFEDPPWAAYYSPSCQYLGFHRSYTSPGVIGHELFHRVIRATADLVYRNASGAANEAFANMFGLVSRNLQGTGTCDVTCAGDAEPNELIDYCDNPDCGVVGDNGGVHHNSRILYLAGELMARGGTHPDTGITVEGIGFERAERLWFDTVTMDLEPHSNLVESCLAMTSRAIRWSLDAEYGFDGDAFCSVNRACASVGLLALLPSCADPEPTPEEAPLLYPLIYEIPYVESDEDGDGVPDHLDNCPELAWTSIQDLDDDGMGDACDADMDGDGYYENDTCPRHRQYSNSWTWPCGDDDGDGIPNADDPCEGTGPPAEFDPDGDGQAGFCDPDEDNDGIPDEDDLCRYWDVPSVLDDDGDGLGNECDICPTSGPPERCFLWGNHCDTDGDGLGDDCDPDLDDDGVPNTIDNCVDVPNPAQRDTDDNGIGLQCDAPERYRYQQEQEELGIDPTVAVSVPLGLCQGAGCAELIQSPTISVAFATQAESVLSIAVTDALGDVVSWLVPVGIDGDVTYYQGSFEPAPTALELALSPPEDEWASLLDFIATYDLTFFPFGDGVGTPYYGILSTWTAYTGPVCGNGVAELGEVCDGPERRGVDTCTDRLFLGGGDIRCNATCDGFDESHCTGCTTNSTCQSAYDAWCLADGRCGFCTVDEDCRAPFLCEDRSCILN